MNSEILKNWEPEEIRESQLNDKKLKFLYNCISDKKEKPNWNQVSPENISVKHYGDNMIGWKYLMECCIENG